MTVWYVIILFCVYLIGNDTVCLFVCCGRESLAAQGKLLWLKSCLKAMKFQ